MENTKVVYFEDSLGNLGTKISDFIKEQESKDNKFKLIDIKHSSSGGLYFGAKHISDSTIHATAIVIYSVEDETLREDYKI